MISFSDLDTAVAEGIISRDQALQLRDLAGRTTGAQAQGIDFSQDTRDEPFRLLRGFRDIFIAIGIVIFAVGLSAMAQAYLGDVEFLAGMFGGQLADRINLLVTTGVLVCAGIGLAEWITRLQRLPLASLVLSVAIAFWSGFFLTAIAVNIAPERFTNVLTGPDAALWTGLGGAVLGLLLYYVRYRLPFALMPLAGVVVALVYMVAKEVFAATWSDEFARTVIGILGVCVFITAMAYDWKDRLRVQRFSECAFWLHLMAAPMIIHSLLELDGEDGTDPVLVLSVMGAMGLVALLIDRRALLVSGLVYMGAAVSRIVSSTEFLADQQFAVTAFILGALLLVLGLAWTPIRRAVVGIMPPGVKGVLPPIASG